MDLSFKEIIENRHQYACDWKTRTNGKVIGYLCSYMPEEIVYAAGVLPVRIIAGEAPPILAERHMAQWTCPFSRGCLQQALEGKYDYLDALVFPFTCFHTHTAFYYWGKYVPGITTYLLELPKAMERLGAKTFLIEELVAFKDWLEKLVGTTISDSDLKRGIEVCNSNRRLMRQVYQLRRDIPPYLSGVEALEMVLSGQLMDKKEHNQLVSQWLEVLPDRKDRQEPGVRLMVIGSVIDKPLVIKIVEDLGANVVIDDLCTGTRYFWQEVNFETEPLSAISARILERTNCPAKLAGERRYQQILRFVNDYNVQGVLVVHEKFCNPHGNDYPNVKKLLDTNNIPSLLLELDIPVPSGQIKNRVQTFIEMLELEKAGKVTS